MQRTLLSSFILNRKHKLLQKYSWQKMKKKKIVTGSVHLWENDPENRNA